MGYERTFGRVAPQKAASACGVLVERLEQSGRLEPMTREVLLKEALKLPHTERADVAAELLASLDEEPADSIEELERAWAAEIERRARRVLTGDSEGVPWEEVKQRIEGRLAK